MAADANPITALLAEKPVLLADGATGTNLFNMGLVSGDAPELWNVDHPDRIEKLHQGFIEAGSDIVLTNTFGGNRHRLKLHDAQDRVAELNSAAARIAKKMADAADRTVLVAGSIGPTGEILAPLGALTEDEAEEAFTEQAAGLAEGGADILWIETMSAKEEMAAAIRGAAKTGLPIVATMTFDSAGRTMMGLAPEDYAAFATGQDTSLAAFGANCGVGPGELLDSINGMRRGGAGDAILVAKGNCGIPAWVDGVLTYSGTVEIMADYARLAMDAGARIIGGCCGTTYAHVASMRQAIDGHTAGEAPDDERIAAVIGAAPWSTMGGRAPEDAGSGSGGEGSGRRRGRRRSS